MQVKLYYPVKTYIKSQSFGENNACYRVSDKKVVSKTGPTCPPDFVDLYAASGMKGHNGLDMVASHGEELYASHSGIVEEISTEEGRGLGIGIVSEHKFDIEGGEFLVKTRYWHLQGFKVKIGDKVQMGDLIGYADNTGFSSGDHLHFELKPVLYDKKGRVYNVFQENGFYGAIDPSPFWTGISAAKDKEEPFKKNLSYGSRGPEVEKLQRVLKRLNYFKYPMITGNYLSETQKAVLAFQLEQGAVAFPIESLWGFYCGPKTRDKLNMYL